MSDENLRSVGRALALLAAFEGGPPAMHVRELAERTGIPRSTTHRLAVELAGWGALDAGPWGYRLGMRIFELGALVPRRRDIVERALPYMDDLFAATGHPVQVGVLDGHEVVYLARSGRQGGRRLAGRVAGRLPAHCTAMGKTLLAASPGALDQVLGRPLRPVTRHTIVVPAVLRAEVTRAARLGFAVERDEAKLGLACVAAPLTDGEGAPIAALSLTGPTTAFEPEQLASAVRATARVISRALAA